MKINPSSGGSDFHFDAECALLCCRLLQVHQNSWPQGLGCRGGKSSYQGDLLISVRYVTVLFWGNLPLKWVLGQRELSTSNVATTCCKAKLEFRTKALPKNDIRARLDVSTFTFWGENQAKVNDYFEISQTHRTCFFFFRCTAQLTNQAARSRAPLEELIWNQVFNLAWKCKGKASLRKKRLLQKLIKCGEPAPLLSFLCALDKSWNRLCLNLRLVFSKNYDFLINQNMPVDFLLALP